MTSFDWLKLLHQCTVVLSISGFTLRGCWMLSGNPLLQQPMVKVVPHLVDTLLLGSAIGMLLIWRVSPLEIDWLGAKLVALLLYIGLGMVALRFGKSRRTRGIAWLLALLCAVYMVTVAFTKSPAGPLQALLAGGS